MAPEREQIQKMVQDIVGPYPSIDAKLLTLVIDLLIDIRDKMYETKINNLGSVPPTSLGDEIIRG